MRGREETLNDTYACYLVKGALTFTMQKDDLRLLLLTTTRTKIKKPDIFFLFRMHSFFDNCLLI